MNPLRAAANAYQVHSSWLGDGGQPVPKTQAQERANVCLQCPKNEPKAVYEALAESAALLVRRQIELKNGMQLRVEGEKSLHVCSACLCVLKLKIWVPLKNILDTTPLDDLNKQNPECWILKESKSHD